MKDRTWIKLYRQIAENPVWKDKPFSKGQAWVDLLLKANYADSEAVINGEKIKVKRGQVFRSVKSLAEEWGWSVNKVRRFCGELTAQGMAQVYGTTNGTLITIENYETFQDVRRADGTAKRRGVGTADGTHNKKYKEIKEERVPRAPSFEEIKEYVAQMKYEMDASAFYDYYSETGWLKKNGQPIRDWKASVRTWARREKEFKKTGQYGNGSKPEVRPPKVPDYDPEYFENIKKGKAQMPDELRRKIEGALK